MKFKALVFGTDDLYPTLKPLYEQEVKRGNLKIIAEVDSLNETCAAANFDLAIISSRNDFYRRMKLLEAQGFPRNRIVDGRVFQVANLDFPRFMAEGIAYGVLYKFTFEADARIIYPKLYQTINGKITLSLGTKSCIRKNSMLEGQGTIALGNFSSFAKNTFFSLGQNHSHNYLNVSTISMKSLDWELPKKFWPPHGPCKILIGNDVWCGHRSTFKSANPNKPLVIGDGAVIASDSVIVKNIPPYAIVGGNPAKIIKFRFSEDVIEALLRIKWWDWDIDKIHDNFKYFNDIEKFISIHDRS